MVWFYHGGDGEKRRYDKKLSIPFWSDFIFIIKRLSALQRETFNPILVWFYHRELLKAIDEVEETFNPILVWFYHYELDYGRCLGTKAFNPILVWFYLMNSLAFFLLLVLLSIPFWSDFIASVDVTVTYTLGFFQSHFGLILSSRWSMSLLSMKKSFNPILVWFYRVNEVWQVPRLSALSIPFWSDFIGEV